MNPRIPFLVMSTVIVVFIVVFHLFGIINGYSKSTFNNPFVETLSYLVVAVVIFWYSNLVFGKQIKVMIDKTLRKKRKFKVLKHDIPEFRLSKNSFDYVSKKDFIKNEKSRVPLFIGTQFGIFPKDYIESENFKNRKIAILGKSLLSGTQSGIKYFILDESTIVELKKNYCISTKLENQDYFENELSLHREMKNIRAKKYANNKINSLGALTDKELVSEFNKKVGLDYFNKNIQTFMNSIQTEFDKRNIDYSEIGNDKVLSFANKINIKDKKIIKTTGNKV